MVGAKKLASLAKITPFRSASSSSAALGSSSLIHASTQLKKELNLIWDKYSIMDQVKLAEDNL